MEISFKGSSEELQSLVLTLGRPIASRAFGDLLPPPPPPAPCSCDLTSDECARLKSSLAALAAAGSGAFLTTDQGSLVAIAHPAQASVMVWTPGSSAWVPDGWPPA